MPEVSVIQFSVIIKQHASLLTVVFSRNDLFIVIAILPLIQRGWYGYSLTTCLLACVAGCFVGAQNSHKNASYAGYVFAWVDF